MPPTQAELNDFLAAHSNCVFLYWKTSDGSMFPFVATYPYLLGVPLRKPTYYLIRPDYRAMAEQLLDSRYVYITD